MESSCVGRRERLVPLVMQAKNWQHGVLLGASMASETTAAATGAVGVVRRDPMAMKPFCGYNFADYFTHWLSMADSTSYPPEIFHVNWFRKDQDGAFMWPGFGENIRVLEWILDRCKGQGDATETAVGYLPEVGAIDTTGLSIDPQTMADLVAVDIDGWCEEMQQIGAYLDSYGERMPDRLKQTRQQVADALAVQT